MKTKISVLFAFMVIVTCSANAQFSVGLRAGITSSSKMDDFSNDQYELLYSTGGFGYHFGAIAQLKVLKLFVQPELLFSTSKSDIAFRDLTDPNGVRQLGTQNFNKLDLPIMVGVKVKFLKLQVGPVGTLLLREKSDLLDRNKVEQNLQKATIGYQAGIGVELGSLLVDFKYEGNLSKLGTSVDIDGTAYSFDQRMSQWVFSVGYLF